MTTKDILYKLCTEFTAVHMFDLTCRGIESKSKSNSAEGGLLGKMGMTTHDVMQKEDNAHVRLIEGKQQKLALFSADEEVDQIHRDRNVNHTVGTIPSQADSARKRNSILPRCVVCTATMSSSTAHCTAYQCETCEVFLCIKMHSRKKKSCFER